MMTEPKPYMYKPVLIRFSYKGFKGFHTNPFYNQKQDSRA